MLNSSLVIVTFLDSSIFLKLSLIYYLFKVHFEVLRGCLVCVFKQLFSVFKQHFTHFNTLFHPHVFSQMFLNNNFQFLNTHTKRILNLSRCVSLLRKCSLPFLVSEKLPFLVIQFWVMGLCLILIIRMGLWLSFVQIGFKRAKIVSSVFVVQFNIGIL